MGLSALTLIIPTYERHDFLVRALEYWSGFSVKVLVFDGSVLPISADILASYSDNITYHHCPRQGFFERLGWALELVDTPYCSLASDDEFFLPSALEGAISNLNSDAGAVACGGQVIGFWRENGITQCKSLYSAFRHRQISDADPYVRMRSHMSNYAPSTIYSVCRSAAWKRAMRLALEKEFPAYALFELEFEIAMAFLGKSRNLDTLFWMRSLENEGTRGTDISLEPERTFDGWWGNECNAGEVDVLLEIMARGLSDGEAGSSELVIEIRRSFEAYLIWLQGYSYRPLHLRVAGTLLRNFGKIARHLTRKPAGTPLADARKVLDFDLDSQASAELEALESYIDHWYQDGSAAASQAETVR